MLSIYIPKLNITLYGSKKAQGKCCSHPLLESKGKVAPEAISLPGHFLTNPTLTDTIKWKGTGQ